jgi:hypothetical protein
MGRRLSLRGRTSPQLRVVAVAMAMSAAVLLLAAVALVTAPDRTRRAQDPPRGAIGRVWPIRSVNRQAGAIALARARSAARQFFAGYLRFAYGKAPASSVRRVARALRRRLWGQRALVAPDERRRHPRVLSLTATGHGRGVVVVTALVDDGGVANYAVRVVVRDTRWGWLVSAVDGD